MLNVNDVRQKNGRICRCGRPCYGYDYVCSLGCQEAAWKENGIEDIPGERSLRSYLIQGCGETVEVRAANADEAARQFRPGCRRLDNVSGSASYALGNESFKVTNA